jgi:hypothetical protein
MINAKVINAWKRVITKDAASVIHLVERSTERWIVDEKVSLFGKGKLLEN